MNVLKRCTALLLVLMIVIGGAFSAQAYEPTGVNVSAESALLVDLTRDTVVYEKNADAKMFPASLTKIMTAVVVLDECEDPSKLTITAAYEALDPLYGTDSSVYGVSIDEEMTALDLLSVMMIYSANDAANVLAYHFGEGNMQTFIDKMNKKATDLGLKGTHFVNAHGLHDSEHYTTARDLYILTKYALEKPLFKEIVSSLYYTVPETNMNTEQVVTTTVFIQDPSDVDYYYEYAKGVKTGYTDAAGRCLITTAEKGDSRYLCVLLKCPVEDAEGNYVREEFPLSKQLYEWAFQSLEYRSVPDPLTTVGYQITEFAKGEPYVPVTLSSGVMCIVPKDLSPDAVQMQVTFDESYVIAPVTKGQKLGTATIQVQGTTVGTVDVIAAADVEKSIFKVVWAAVRTFFSYTIVKVILWILLVLVLLILLFIGYCFYCRARNRRRRKRRIEERRRRMEQQSRNPFDIEQ